MYSDAGFDVSGCGRYLALCELDPAVGYHLRIFSLQRPTLGSALQTVTLPNCPFVTSVQFAPLSFAVLIGYGRSQRPSVAHAPPRADDLWVEALIVLACTLCAHFVFLREAILSRPIRPVLARAARS